LGKAGRAAARIDVLLARATQRARWSIFWERLWPALASLLTAFGFFLAASWLGVWLWLPLLARGVVLLAFVVIFIFAAIPAWRLRFPTPAEGLRRLDRGSGLPHRPATAVTDNLATKAEDPLTVALWRAHVARALEAARGLRAGLPFPRLALRDPAALRALAFILVAATFVAAGGERWQRIVAAFDWTGVMTPENFRVDAWVSPPAYTGRSPIILPGLKRGETVAAAPTYDLPVGSAIVVRATGQSGVDVQTTGGLAPGKGEDHVPTGTEEHRFTLAESGSATVRGPAGPVTWTFNAIPDKPPTIKLTKEPQSGVRGALELNYAVEDDYGVIEGKAEIKKAEVKTAAPTANADGDAKAQPRPLYDAPDVKLVMPQARTRKGEGKTVKDLTQHPWAGAEVTMTLVARDQGGNEGRSEPVTFELPQRIFIKPLARALVDLRRILALNADARPQIMAGLDALSIAPEKFTPEAGVYLGLRSIYWNLANAKSDDDLRGVADRLWQMAVNIEDGTVGDAEQALHAAEERLRQALDRNASDDEIKRLTNELRAALDKFLQALAEQLQKNPQALNRPLDPNTQMLRSQDLQAMIDQLENLARSGNRDAARQLLQNLQAMLNNLQMGQMGQQGDQSAEMKSLEEMADMIRRQQRLRDRTYQQGQDQRDRQRGQRGQQGNQMGELQQNQQALRQQLQKLLEEMRKGGMGQQQTQRGQRGQQGQGQRGQQGQQGQQGEQGDGGMAQLGEAGKAMGEAEGSLGEGNADSAVDAQGRALDALRKGAQNFAQSMQQQQSNGPGRGQPGRFGRARADQNTDPLGRPMRGRDYGDDTTVKVPGEIDAQRARRILEELRRRFSDPQRPQIELDYIERLLKDF
jgi:uncharacterized protein (TIGR02302 family)